MKNTTLLDANVLLDWPVYRARELFRGPGQEMKAFYRRMVHLWHPDHSKDPKAHEVFIHLQRLYQAASKHSSVVELQFRDHLGKQFLFQAQERRNFELGAVYRGKASLAYLVRASHEAEFQNYLTTVNSLTYASETMREQFTPQLPVIHAHHQGKDGSLLIVRRDPNAVLLRDLLNHLTQRGEQLDPTHMGWVLNALHNLACYLSHASVAHHAIGLDTVWINPEKHSVQLLGGWFHALPFGSTIRALPISSAALAPRSYLSQKTASPRLDQECIRALGRALLGDISGNRLNDKTPSAMVSALRLPACGTAVEEYQRWKQALQASFGAPKFVALKLSHNEIYQGEYHG